MKPLNAALREEARRAVEAMPPLTSEQRDALRDLLAPVATSKAQVRRASA